MIGQFYGPVRLLLGIDLEEAALLEPAAIAIVNSLDREFDVVGAHIDSAAPLAALIVIEGVDVVEAGAKLVLNEHGAGGTVYVPPAFADPALFFLVAYGDADAARCAIAQLASALAGLARKRPEQSNRAAPTARAGHAE